MFSIRIALLCVFSLFAFACSKNEPVKYAIVYGISQYPYMGFELPYSANDATSVSKLRIINDQDLLLFYFSGHGLSKQTMLEVTDSIVDDDYFSMLLYHDYSYNSLVEYINDNSLSNKKLAQLFYTLPYGIKIGVIDACYSGHMIADQSVIDYIPDNYDGTMIQKKDFGTIFHDAVNNFHSLKNKGSRIGYTLLTSCGRNEMSWDGFFSHSVFTYFFLMSAEQGDLNKDGVITALESYCYIYAAFQKYWNTPKQDSDWNFLPRITGGAEDIIIFEHPTIINSAILNSQ